MFVAGFKCAKFVALALRTKKGRQSCADFVKEYVFFSLKMSASLRSNKEFLSVHVIKKLIAARAQLIQVQW